MNLRMKGGIAGAVAREINRLDAGHCKYEGIAYKAALIESGANSYQVCMDQSRDVAAVNLGLSFGARRLVEMTVFRGSSC